MSLTSRKVSLRGMRTFCTAARHQTLRQAAEELFITPSAVSHQIKKLEGELGVLLFRKEGRTLSLTEAGRMLFEESIEAMDRLETATARVRGTYSRVTLQVSVQPYFASELLIPALGDFREKHPAVNISIDAGDGATEKHPESMDVSIRLFSKPPGKLQVQKLFPLTLVPACSPELRASFHELSAGWNLPFPMVVHASRPTAWKKWAAQCGIKLPAASHVLKMDSMTAVVGAAERGMGVALVPLQLSQSSFRAGRLVQLFDHGLQTPDAYYVVHRAECADRPDVQAFASWVSTTFRDEEIN